MSINKESKKNLISEFATNEKDTGSTEVQIAILTQRIKGLTEHLKLHKHDHHTRKGLMVIVGKRKSILNYLSKTDNTKYLIFFSDMFEFRNSNIPVSQIDLKNFKILVVCSSEAFEFKSCVFPATEKMKRHF